MKILCLGDSHGRSTWQKHAKEVKEYDKIIFLGDYVDSFDKTDQEIIDNLKDILQFKKENIDKAELLLGNHDLMYMFLPTNKLWRCSGFRQSYSSEIHYLFNENKKLFKASYQINNWFFSHAGLTRLFLKNLRNKIPDNFLSLNDNNYSEYINTIFESSPNYLSDISYYRGGNRPWGGPFWADIREFSNQSILPLNCVMGHQPVKNITKKTFTMDNNEYTYIWIDTESHPKSEEPSYTVLTI